MLPRKAPLAVPMAFIAAWYSGDGFSLAMMVNPTITAAHTAIDPQFSAHTPS